tara:strand:- start:1042 stop:1710 length:669 start_codon:yes stop_codon:yes gene_type:complete
MAEYTGEVIYETPQVKSKLVVNPALVNALVPPARSTPSLSPQDQRAFDLAEAKRKSDVQTKIAEENRAAARKLEEEQRAVKAKSAEIDLKKSKNLENLPTLISRAKAVLKGESVDETGAVTKAPLPTQSLGGSIIDAVGAFVGKTPQGAAQADRLGVIGGAMVLAMPRMEGPQSDADTKLYREMAGKVGDNTISTERRLAALDEVEKIYSKYNKTSEWKVVK